MKKILFAAMALMMAMTVHAIEQKSPNGNIVLNVELNAKGTPEYQVTYKGRPVIKPSTLGIELAEENSLMDQFRINKTSTSSFDETWQPIWGETHDILNRYNELLLEMEKPSNGRYMNLRFRVYDDGIGFR